MQVKVYVKEMKQRGRKWGVVLLLAFRVLGHSSEPPQDAELALKR